MRTFRLVTAAAVAVLSLTVAPSAAVAKEKQPFDLQAHRGGVGLAVESSLLSFGTALDLGVSTLELDVQITEDGHAVVTHDRRTNPDVCTDTAPATPGDPEFPYVGRYVNTLTLAQVLTLNCGSTRKPAYPAQQLSPGARMLQLHEVFDLVEERGADDVRFNIETKVEAGAPDETAPREQFVQVVAAEVRRAGVADRVSVQSFDWGALMRMREVAPELPIVALTNGDFLQVGQPGASPWLGGIDIDDFGGSLVAAAASFGADAISPVHGMPQASGVTQPGYTPFTTKEMVKEAHKAGMQVIPWTVNDVPTMNALIEAGVDGLITDHPDRLRWLMEQRGMALPRAYPAA
ncbi:glycerophosphodiester phosphodiesterase family protein [Pseudonocardia nigra]|uniref:glycerophosphodiester phosphodiesterase family protein n=1 Tax=Pseudonocardia nigra TaxID=1921578 RepID=UPI001C5DFBF0|nr:glycerophosphodiester phosphodiesterase family protein [Pseudonocardia nigra]